MLALRLIAAASLACLLSGCKAPAPSGCMEPFAGDRMLPMEAVLGLEVVVDGGARMVDVSDGDTVFLLPPPQGGFVIYAGVRAKNFDPCGAIVKGQLRHPADHTPASDFDRRSADYVPAPPSSPWGAGWFVPRALGSFSMVPNIPVCPDNTGGGALDATLLLEVTLTDKSGRSATVARTVKTTCPKDACLPECACTCSPNYMSGKCGADAGVLPTDGGDPCGR
ncbi:MAG: hypothetical protein EXR72_00080 [Myxococcales bacterium]|nr:hypothetical protein [Myxococcales bacterium]